MNQKVVQKIKPRQIVLSAISLEKSSELKWLHRFITTYHSTPKVIMPTLKDLKIPTHRYFRALAKFPGNPKWVVVGVTSYEIRTRFLAETQKTVIDPRFREQGWGRAVSDAIEKEVKRNGFKKVRTTIYSNNLKMIQIKLDQGYTIEGFHPDHEAPGVHEYSLGKVL
jgi:GNAT superfamily N-acetyltransferase